MNAQSFQRSDVQTEISEQGCQVDRFTLYSRSMERDIKVVVVLPPVYNREPAARFPILYTLHGYGAPYDTWAVMSKLQKELKTKPFIYTCFDGDVGSYYIDSFYPAKTARNQEARADETPKKSLFKTFFFDEFMPAIDEWYRVNPDKRAVTGFSMGGCGAMSFMLEKPAQFSSVSGLSSTYFDYMDPHAKSTRIMLEYLGPQNEFPERYAAHDHYQRIEKHLAAGGTYPPIYQHIGTEDFLLEQNHKFRDYAEAQGLDLTYMESPGGHDWKFWHPASVGVAEFHWAHWQD